MRITLIWFFILFTFISLTGQSVLDEKIDFKVENIPVTEALLELSAVADINISFSNDIFKNTPSISIDEKNITVKDVLNTCLARQSITYAVDGESIVLTYVRKMMTLSGYIKDKSSGERLIGAYIINSETGFGTTTNEYGFFSLTLREGDYNILISYIGYKDILYELSLLNNKTIDFQMEIGNKLTEVVVLAARIDSIPYESSDESSETPNNKMFLSPQDLGHASTLGGETDVIQAAYLTPGVQSGVSGLGGMNVRGGNKDQNLILMDGVTVYNHQHALGLVSIFNSSAINKTSLIKGGFSAQYGGRLSSVFDIRTKEGNINKFEGDLFLGTFASRLSFQGPFKKGKAGFFFSVRRTHLDPIIQAISKIAVSDASERITNYNFFDINAKIHWKVNDRNKIYYSFYRGGDKYSDSLTDKEILETSSNELSNKRSQQLNWGNIIQSIRWNNEINNKLFLNTTAIFSTYDYNSFQGNEVRITSLPNNELIDFQNTFSNINNGIVESGIKMDFDYTLNTYHNMKMGISYSHKEYSPGISFVEDTEVPTDLIQIELNDSLEIDGLSSNEMVIYFQDRIRWNNLLIETGIYSSLFASKDKTYFTVEPRFNAVYSINPNFNLNFTTTRMSQNLHLLSNEGVSLPNDLWVPATRMVRPQSAWQTSLGFNWKLAEDITFSSEGYIKYLKNVIAFKQRIENPQVSNIVVTNWEEESIQGKGRSMGWETILKKRRGKTRGWVSYTLSKSTRQFEGLNDGIQFPYSYDRKHLVQVVLKQRLSKKTNLSANWIYGTGRPITLISATTLSFFQDSDTEIIGDINGYRLPDYHQLNIGFDFDFKKKWGGQKLSLGVYNSYNRYNTFYQYYEKINGVTSPRLNNLTFLPVFPTISYGIYFK